MASFYEPNQGANALDELVSNMQQQRRETRAENVRERKEQDANTKFNIAYGNKLLGHADVTGGHWSPQYNQTLNSSLQELGQNANLPPAQYAMLADTHAAELAAIHNTQADYNQKVENYAGQVKALGGDPMLFKNNVANQAFTTDGKTPRAARDIDVDGTIANVMAKPNMYISNPDATIQTYYKGIKPVFNTENYTNANAATGASTTNNATYSYIPQLTQYNKTTQQVEPVSEPVLDEKGNAIPNRNMLGENAMSVINQSPALHRAYVAKLLNANPNIDPESNEGKDFIRELAYNDAMTHVGGKNSVTVKTTQGDPTRSQRMAIMKARLGESQELQPLNVEDKKLQIQKLQYEIDHPKTKGGSIFSTPSAATAPTPSPTPAAPVKKHQKNPWE